MKTMIISLLALVGAVSASADGFQCINKSKTTLIKLYNNTQPSAGTRNAAIMVLSDPRVQAGRKTIARFTDVNDTISNHGAKYIANVDLRYGDSSRAGENVLGTKLGNIDAIMVAIDFTYSQPTEHGALLAGKAIVAKRNGEETIHPLSCKRYLKN